MKDDVGDSAKANPGRMYDYVIGGTHNLEVDRVAATVKLVPSIVVAFAACHWLKPDHFKLNLAPSAFAAFS